MYNRRLNAFLFLVQKHAIPQNYANGGWWGGGLEPTRASVLSSNFVLLFQIIVIQKEPDHPSFLIDIKSKGTFSSKKEPIGKVWYIANLGQSPYWSINIVPTNERVAPNFIVERE